MRLLLDIRLKAYRISVIHELRLFYAHQPVCYCECLLKSVTEGLMGQMQNFMTHAA